MIGIEDEKKDGRKENEGNKLKRSHIANIESFKKGVKPTTALSMSMRERQIAISSEEHM